jgi:hypothetical protein
MRRTIKPHPVVVPQACDSPRLTSAEAADVIETYQRWRIAHCAASCQACRPMVSESLRLAVLALRAHAEGGAK